MTRHSQARKTVRAQGLARALGWVSIGLGVAEVVAPLAMARWLGLRPSTATLLRLHGVREIAAGIGILGARNSAPWLWARVGGDLCDLATLAGGADHSRASALKRASLAAGGVAAITALDAYTAQSYKQPPRPLPREFDYGSRSGFPRPPEAMRGVAAADASRQTAPTPVRAGSTSADRPAPGDEGEADASQSSQLSCPRCHGSGRIEGRPCPECEGSGRVTVIVGDA